MSKPDERLLYIEMLHSAVNRLANQSFILKTLAFSGTATLLTLNAAQTDNAGIPLFAGIAIAAIIGLWVLDTQYMRTERAVRAMVQAVAKNSETKLFAWNIQDYIRHMSWKRAAFSWSLIWFYFGLLCVVTFSLFM